MDAAESIAIRASRGSAYPQSAWTYVARDMAHRVDVFGSAKQVARDYSQQETGGDQSRRGRADASRETNDSLKYADGTDAWQDDPASERHAVHALDATAVNLIQEAILEETRNMPLPHLSGEVLVGAEIFREDPFTRYGGPPNGATDARIGWYTNAMVAATYAVDEQGTCACAAIDITKPHEPRLAEFMREVAGGARCVMSTESRLIANACADASVPYREIKAGAPELAALNSLRTTITPIMMEATKGAEASYVDGNLSWYSLVSQWERAGGIAPFHASTATNYNGPQQKDREFPHLQQQRRKAATPCKYNAQALLLAPARFHPR